MALIVYDMGRRVDTPFTPIANRIRATSSSAPISAIGNNPNHTPNEYTTAVNAYLNQEEKTPDPVAFIHDIMHREIRTLSPDTLLIDALAIIQETGFHNFPVINQSRNVLAMFSDHALLHALVKQSKSTLDFFWRQTIMSVAVHPVLCVLENTDIRQTSNLMYEYNVDALPVLNSYNELCGIVTRSDILKLISHYGPMELWA